MPAVGLQKAPLPAAESASSAEAFASAAASMPLAASASASASASAPFAEGRVGGGLEPCLPSVPKRGGRSAAASPASDAASVVAAVMSASAPIRGEDATVCVRRVRSRPRRRAASRRRRRPRRVRPAAAGASARQRIARRHAAPFRRQCDIRGGRKRLDGSGRGARVALTAFRKSAPAWRSSPRYWPLRPGFSAPAGQAGRLRCCSLRAP